METIDLTPILQIAIVLIATVITSFVIPLIKSKTTQEQWQTIQNIAKVGVYAAEVIFGAGTGEQKFEYVSTYIKEFCLKNGYYYDTKTIKQAIENAWKEMTDAEKNTK